MPERKRFFSIEAFPKWCPKVEFWKTNITPLTQLLPTLTTTNRLFRGRCLSLPSPHCSALWPKNPTLYFTPCVPKVHRTVQVSRIVYHHGVRSVPPRTTQVSPPVSVCPALVSCCSRHTASLPCCPLDVRVLLGGDWPATTKRSRPSHPRYQLLEQKVHTQER